MNDLRFALRQWVRQPGFALAAVGILALAIGANVAVFRIVDALHFQPLPVPEPDRLVAFTIPEAGSVFSEERFQTLRAQTNVWPDATAWAGSRLVVRRAGQGTRRSIQYVAPNYFEVLGVKAQLGRNLGAEDRKRPHLVITDRWWLREYQRDPGVIGSTVEAQGVVFTIVGVMPAGFVGVDRLVPAEGWIPYELEADLGRVTAVRYSDERWLNVLARLRPGLELERASVAVRAMEAEVLEPWMVQQGRHVELVACGRGLAPVDQRREGALVSVFGTTVMALVLVPACANLASLMLSRGWSRRRELAVRLALGASRFGILRQLLVESLVLALVGGGLGMLLSAWGLDVALAAWSTTAELELEAPGWGSLVGCTLGLSALATLLFGLGPAWQLAPGAVGSILKDETPGLMGGARGWVMRHGLVVAQVAVCCLLLVATGVVGRSFQQRRSLETGFDPSRVWVVSVWDKEPATAPGEFHARLDNLRQELGGVPGVEAVSLVTDAPMGQTVDGASVRRDGVSEAQAHQVIVNALSPGFFDTLRVPLRAGRDFSPGDQPGTVPVVVVSERLAQALFPDAPLAAVPGHRVIYHGTPIEIIGVVGEIRYLRFNAPHLSGAIYLSAVQQPDERPPDLLVRTRSGDPGTLAAVSSLVRQADPGGQRPSVQSYQRYMDQVLARERMTTWLLGVAGAVALGLACLGLYSVLSFQVIQRTRELGLRIALGARRGQVLGLVLGRGMLLTVVGLVLGVGGAVGLVPLLRHLLPAVGSADAGSYAGVLGLLMAVALAACWWPARRATRIDPMTALRRE